MVNNHVFLTRFLLLILIYFTYSNSRWLICISIEPVFYFLNTKIYILWFWFKMFFEFTPRRPTSCSFLLLVRTSLLQYLMKQIYTIFVEDCSRYHIANIRKYNVGDAMHSWVKWHWILLCHHWNFLFSVFLFRIARIKIDRWNEWNIKQMMMK